MWPMPNVMAAQPNIGGALCESSVILFLVARCKLRLMPPAQMPWSNAANIGERKTWMQSKFCTGKIPSWGNSPQKCIYSAPAQEMAKHRANFGWLPLSEIAAVTKPRCEPIKFFGVPQINLPISAASGPKFAIL